MFMEGPKNILVDPSMTTGAGAVNAAKQVSVHSAPVDSGKSSEISGNGATVSGSGKPEAAAGQALLGMIANGIAPTNGFFNGKTEKKLTEDGANIETHVAALLLDGPAANGPFQKLIELASRGPESSSGKVDPREIELGKQAMPLDGPDAKLLGAALRLAFHSADRQGPVTTKAIINSFHEATE